MGSHQADHDEVRLELNPLAARKTVLIRGSIIASRGSLAFEKLGFHGRYSQAADRGPPPFPYPPVINTPPVFNKAVAEN